MQIVRMLLVIVGLVLTIGGLYLIAIDLGGEANLPGFEVAGFKFEAGKMPTGIIASLFGVVLISVAGKNFKRTVTTTETEEETHLNADGVVETIKRKIVEKTIEMMHR